MATKWNYGNQVNKGTDNDFIRSWPWSEKSFMNEEEFINSFDCKFPYEDQPKWIQIIEEGCKMSSNAAFAVLHEICRPPHGKKVTSKQLREMADYWSENANFPLAVPISKAAYAMIDHQELSVSEVIEIMNIVSNHRNEYSALAIAYFSCDDMEGVVEDRYKEIISSWAVQN